MKYKWIIAIDSDSCNLSHVRLQKYFEPHCDVDVHVVPNSNVTQLRLSNFWNPEDAYDVVQRCAGDLRSVGIDVIYTSMAKE